MSDISTFVLPDGSPVVLRSYAQTNSQHADLRWMVNGDIVRVVIAGDVLALPDDGWSWGGFGLSITPGWLMELDGRYNGRGKLPGQEWKRQRAAAILSASLDFHHGHGDPDTARDVPAVKR